MQRIAIDDEAYEKLQECGVFGENFSDTIERLSKMNDATISENNGGHGSE